MQPEIAVKQKGLSTSALKLIAIITMAIDHIGAVVFEMGLFRAYDPALMESALSQPGMLSWYLVDTALRTIGRVAFPLFCFMLVQGFLHTRNRGKYLARLAAFALISEIPFDVAVFNRWFYFGYQNIYFTLVLGMLAMMGLDWCEKNNKKWPMPLIIAACCATAWLLHTDYDVLGVLTIVSLYLLRNQRRWCFVVTGIILLAESWMLLGAAVLALLFIWRYNGQKGNLKGKWFFYWFYPAHLFLLFLVRWLIMGVAPL